MPTNYWSNQCLIFTESCTAIRYVELDIGVRFAEVYCFFVALVIKEMKGEALNPVIVIATKQTSLSVLVDNHTLQALPIRSCVGLFKRRLSKS